MALGQVGERGPGLDKSGRLGHGSETNLVVLEAREIQARGESQRLQPQAEERMRRPKTSLTGAEGRHVGSRPKRACLHAATSPAIRALWRASSGPSGRQHWNALGAGKGVVPWVGSLHAGRLRAQPGPLYEVMAAPYESCTTVNIDKTREQSEQFDDDAQHGCGLFTLGAQGAMAQRFGPIGIQGLRHQPRQNARPVSITAGDVSKRGKRTGSETRSETPSGDHIKAQQR